MNRKELSIGLILLLIGTSIIPITAQNTQKPSQTASRGSWLYVGGSGPGNYSKIQDAIDDASIGDTVFVFSGIYYERIEIDKAIQLIGELKNKTIIIDNSNAVNLIDLDSSNITISGFTLSFIGDLVDSRTLISSGHVESFRNIRISDNILLANISQGIFLQDCDFCSIAKNIFYINISPGILLFMSNNCTITDNIFYYSEIGSGIHLTQSWYCTVSNNSFIFEGLSSTYGVKLQSSWYNTISNNNFFNITLAISLEGCFYNSILFNHIENPKSLSWKPRSYRGIEILHCSSVTIQRNFISYFYIGIFIESSYYVNISLNTFIKNKIDARFLNTGKPSMNTWDQNYWERPRLLPKPIFGIKYINLVYPGFFEFDWHPAKEPYDIGI